MTADVTADVRSLSAPDLVKLAKAVLAKGKAHWSVAAIALGRITDERLFEKAEYGAAVSPEAWAKDKLGMTRGEVALALKLWRAMERHPEVPWGSLPKPRALLLDEVLSAGGNVADWTAKARNATSTTAFEREVRSRLGDAPDTFHTLRIRYPESMAEMVEEAFQQAAHAAQSTGEGNDTPPEEKSAPEGTEGPAKLRWQDPAIAFRALEVILVDYLQPRAAA